LMDLPCMDVDVFLISHNDKGKLTPYK